MATRKKRVGARSAGEDTFRNATGRSAPIDIVTKPRRPLVSHSAPDALLVGGGEDAGPSDGEEEEKEEEEEEEEGAQQRADDDTLIFDMDDDECYDAAIKHVSHVEPSWMDSLTSWWR